MQVLLDARILTATAADFYKCEMPTAKTRWA